MAAPSTFTIVGGGYGHGIGMSQYGAHGMALRGAGAGRIISFYYGGAQARPATLPALVRGVEVPGKGGSGRFSVSGVTPGGRTVRRTLSGHATWSIKPESGGTSVFDLSRRRVFGPTSAGSGPSEVHVRFGRTSDHGYVGDWNGNGTWTPGVLRAGTRWYLKDSFTGGAAGVGLAKQTPGTLVVGDWDNRP